MAFPLFNSIATWFLKKRIHQIELFIKYPHEVQQEVLQDLVGMAKKTKMGYQHDFRSLNTYAAFSRRVPIVQYEDIAEEINTSRLGEDNLFGQPQLSGMPNLVEQQMQKASTSP